MLENPKRSVGGRTSNLCAQVPHQSLDAGGPLRKKSVSGEEPGTGSLYHQAEGSWCEGDKAFSLKKKRIMHKDNDNEKSVKNVRDRNGALMECSRYSRVNGRRWRCCRQKLVRYSLCEHHLGKGRLRSITNVKGRSNDNAAKKEDLQPPLSKRGSDQKTVMKLVTVKARSISCCSF
ncbi:hypothetical protein F3Y22_tig00111621pilonHSYRG00074 [Hibiscus syriacus]|uniref:WRC domain-containing protein n=1 Tax=Hibiscus syriacus TaxID=106335 RepID=A0A6A2Y562_HIBSY|nr:hypothetical protein F3Y22_tig00111621pilonHSYRG00074 [Hibiscus syriacus]